MSYSKKDKAGYAKRLRRHGTRAEKIARPYLALVGYKCQVYDPTGFLPDFYSSVFRVAIEIDGSVHGGKAQKQQDKYKDSVRRKNKVYTMRAGNTYAINAPIILMGEALLTGVIYRMYRTIRNVTI